MLLTGSVLTKALLSGFRQRTPAHHDGIGIVLQKPLALDRIDLTKRMVD